MNYLSGQPLYCYELARELQRTGHQVSIISNWDNPTPAAQVLAKRLAEHNIRCLDWNHDASSRPRFILASEADSSVLLDKYPDVPAFNIIHSEYPVERPIISCPNIRARIAIRPSIKEHWESTTPGPWHVIYNGVDRERFSAKKVKTQVPGVEHWLVPCTRDPLREKFLLHLVSLANEKRIITIIGKDFGVVFPKNGYLNVLDEIFDIEEYYAGATSVHGILLGRINIEARSMGIPTYMWNPETMQYTLWDIKDAQFDERHNIKNVADQIVNLCFHFLKTSPQ